jgi:hypothetical protein
MSAEKVREIVCQSPPAVVIFKLKEFYIQRIYFRFLYGLLLGITHPCRGGAKRANVSRSRCSQVASVSEIA